MPTKTRKPLDKAQLQDRRERYRHDPAFRNLVLASNARSREKRKRDPLCVKIDRLGTYIFYVRESVDYHMRKTRQAERRLLAMTKQREELRAKYAKQRGPLYRTNRKVA